MERTKDAVRKSNKAKIVDEEQGPCANEAEVAPAPVVPAHPPAPAPAHPPSPAPAPMPAVPPTPARQWFTCNWNCTLRKVRVVTGLSMLITVNLALIVVGSIFINSCPAQPTLPYALILFDVLFITATVLITIDEVYNVDSEYLDYVISFVLWFIIIDVTYSSIIVYSLFSHVNFKDVTFMDDYCDETLYILTFMVMTFVFCPMILIFGSAALLWLCFRVCWTRNE